MGGPILWQRRGGSETLCLEGCKQERQGSVGSSTERRQPEPHPPLRLEKWFALAWAGGGPCDVLSRAGQKCAELKQGRARHWPPGVGKAE